MANEITDPAGMGAGTIVGMYPQPHEGIVGTERTEDDLLALDEKALARRDIILRVAEQLWSATLVGHAAPKVTALYERMNKPQPGDIVFVVDGMWSKDPDRRAKAFGVFLLDRQEWWTTDDEWAKYVEEEPDEVGERMTDHAWYVQYGPQPGDICRWTNCSVRALPVEMEV